LWKQAIEASPAYAPAYYNVAVVHSEAGRAAEAVAQYRAALAASPKYAEAWCNLGVIYKNQVGRPAPGRCPGAAYDALPRGEAP